MVDEELCAGDPVFPDLPQVDDGNTVGRAGCLNRSFGPAGRRNMVPGIDQPVDCQCRIDVGAELPEKPARSLVAAAAAARGQFVPLNDFNIGRQQAEDRRQVPAPKCLIQGFNDLSRRRIDDIAHLISPNAVISIQCTL